MPEHDDTAPTLGRIDIDIRPPSGAGQGEGTGLPDSYGPFSKPAQDFRPAARPAPPSDNSAKYEVAVRSGSPGAPAGLEAVLGMLQSAIQPRATPAGDGAPAPRDADRTAGTPDDGRPAGDSPG